MTSHPASPPDEYRAMAERMRAVAAATRKPEVRRQFLALAESWDVSAERAHGLCPAQPERA